MHGAAMTGSIWSEEPSHRHDQRADERNDIHDENESEALTMEEVLWESAEGVEAAEAPLSAATQEP